MSVSFLGIEREVVQQWMATTPEELSALIREKKVYVPCT